MDPMHECRGLCLASAATRKGDPSALASSTDTSGQHDKLPVHTQTCRMCSVVRHRMCAVLPWPPGTLIPCHQEPNYSFGGQCLNRLSVGHIVPSADNGRSDHRVPSGIRRV